jgi:hypothetical protein
MSSYLDDDTELIAYGALSASHLLSLHDDPLPRSYATGFLSSLLAKDEDDFQRILRVPRALFDSIVHQIRDSIEYRRFPFMTQIILCSFVLGGHTWCPTLRRIKLHYSCTILLMAPHTERQATYLPSRSRQPSAL